MTQTVILNQESAKAVEELWIESVTTVPEIEVVEKRNVADSGNQAQAKRVKKATNKNHPVKMTEDASLPKNQQRLHLSRPKSGVQKNQVQAKKVKKWKWTNKVASDNSWIFLKPLILESDTSGPTTQSGRPLRHAASEMKKKLEDLEKQAEEIDREVDAEASGDESGKPEIDAAKIIGQPRRPTKRIIDDDEDDFEPEENVSGGYRNYQNFFSF